MSDAASPALAARLAELRISYESATLTEGDLPAAPLPAFVGWFDAAVDAGLPEPNAMVLSTADASGSPSSRTVLLKQADPRGFVFFTNLGSRKGRELAENPRASLLFPWIFMQRQVIVTGAAQLIDRDEVAEYWATRPEKSRIGAWASRQSSVLDGRDALERRYAELEERFGVLGRLARPGRHRGVLAGSQVSAARPVAIPSDRRRCDVGRPRRVDAGATVAVAVGRLTAWPACSSI